MQDVYVQGAYNTQLSVYRERTVDKIMEIFG
jgi:hypothetical protein